MSRTEQAAQTGDAERGGPYHHGNLKQALLDAAEALLRREGVGGLSLRAAAAEVGVSHAAPKNHFGDLRGLQSELAASGFRRLAVEMRAALDEAVGHRSGWARVLWSGATTSGLPGSCAKSMNFHILEP